MPQETEALCLRPWDAVETTGYTVTRGECSTKDALVDLEILLLTVPPRT